MVKKVYKENKMLLADMLSSVHYMRQQNYSRGMKKCASCIDKLISLVPEYMNIYKELESVGVTIDIDVFLGAFKNIEEAQANSDYILLADMIENLLISNITNIQEGIVSLEEDYYSLIINENENIDYKYIDELMKKGLYIEPTSQGYATIRYDNEEKNIYFHTNIYPTKSAIKLSDEWYSEYKFHYIIYGLGLGYEVYELINKSDAIKVDVYEQNKDIINLARSFGVIKELEQSGQVTIHYDPDFQKIASCDLEGEYTKFVVHYPSVRIIADDKQREWFENYFTNYNAVSNQELTMLRSFVENQKLNFRSADEIHPSLKNKDVYVIAAGPSLDKNMNQLKNVSDNGVIISTGTVLKKLLANDIVPDYVVIIDANSPTLKQIEGIENCGVPLIFLSTAYYGTVAAYNADRYIACQYGYDKAQELAKKNGYRLYNTGGSVTTLCIDLALQAHCKRLICVGLDLAFTGGFDHASDTAQMKAVDDTSVVYRKVKAIAGGYVNTSKGLDVFRLWIEKRIEGIKDIEIIDATEGGALIKGTKIMALSECVR